MRWGLFHDKIADHNYNKMDNKNGRYVFLSLLYGRAKYICEGIDEEVL